MSKRGKWKCMARRSGDRVYVRCPDCGEEQELVLGDEDYSVDERGLVHPDFVCMSHPGGRYCGCAGPLWIVNW